MAPVAFKTAIAVIVAALVATDLQADVVYRWNHGGIGNWNSAANWEQGAVPGQVVADAAALIGDGPGSGGTAVVDSVVPTLSRWTLGGASPGDVGHLEIRPGGLLVTSSASGNLIGGAGRGTLNMTGGTVRMAGRLEIDDGQVVLAGGRMELTSPTQGNISLGLSNSASWVLNTTGELDVAGRLFVGFGGTGTFSQSGGTLHVRNDLMIGVAGGSGTYSFSSGSAVIDGNLVLGNGGTGRLNLLGEFGTLRADRLVVESGSTVHATIIDDIAAVGTASYALAGVLDVQFFSDPVVGQRFTLITASGSQPPGSAFDTLPQGAMFLAPAPSGSAHVQISYRANVDGGPVANDVTLTVLPLALIAGDANFDGAVNRRDLALLLSGFGKRTGATWSDGDFNDDGAVNVRDLAILTGHIQPSPGDLPPSLAAALPQPVPEPTSGTLLLLAAGLTAATLACRRRHRIRCQNVSRL